MLGVGTGVFLFLFGVDLYWLLINCSIFCTFVKWFTFRSWLLQLNNLSLMRFLPSGRQTTNKLITCSRKFNSSSWFFISSSFYLISWFFSIDFFLSCRVNVYSFCTSISALEISSSFIFVFCYSITCCLSIERFLYEAISFSTFSLNSVNWFCYSYIWFCYSCILFY